MTWIEIAPQDMGDAVDLGLQLGVGPAVVLADDGGAFAAPGGYGRVKQFGHAVQAHRVLQFGQVEVKVGPLGRRRR